MASYAALLSLKNIIDTLQNHPNPPISLDSLQVEALLEKVHFLKEFLEAYSHQEAYPIDNLESLIRDGAYAAEDVIESYIVDRIDGSTSYRGDYFYQDLQRVIEDQMDYVKKEAMEIKEKMRSEHENHQHISSISDHASIVSPSLGQKTTVVGFEDVLLELLDKLTGQQSRRQIIPIVGMGGIGKTMLAIKAYQHEVVVQYFDICVWVTISQTFSTREILFEILCQSSHNSKEGLNHLSEEMLGEKIYKNFSGMRYLIVMDDTWSFDVWNNIKYFFPDHNNGSRMIVTTRELNVATQLTSSGGIQMSLLNEDESWSLFCKCVFGEDACPVNYMEIGKVIVRNCRGLPLSINVVGGILAKSKMTKQHWKYIAKNLSSIVNLDDNEHCLKILHMSYEWLPVHLKPIFLYMGVFHEDATIRVSWLVRLLVAEGFLKPVNNKSLEVVAKEYIKELVDRNLLMVHKWGSIGNLKFCKIHDLLRDLCLRIAKKENFLYVMGDNNVDTHKNLNMQRRMFVHDTPEVELYPVMQLTSLARSWICHIPENNSRTFNQKLLLVLRLLAHLWICQSKEVLPPSCDCRLLRIYKAIDKCEGGVSNYTRTVLQLHNLRYIATRSPYDHFKVFNLPPISRFWNLQMLTMEDYHWSITKSIEIWKMPQLRHVYFSELHLPIPHNDDFILWNLQTLSGIKGFKCSEEVIQKIPNIKKLKIIYSSFDREYSSYCINNLERLLKLEHLQCRFWNIQGIGGVWRPNLLQNLTFPHSLKKLNLDAGNGLYWEEMNTIIGSIACLEKLTLKEIIGLEWAPSEAQFLCLKYLEISFCRDLESWMVDSTQFPVLNHLVLRCLRKLKEIPTDIGERPTLQSIVVSSCSDSVADSAQAIQEEQKELGNSSLVVRIYRGG